MAKQSMKQEVLQSIVNSQLQQAIQANQQEESNKIRADFENWQKQQMEPANIQADFNNWLQSQNAQAAQIPSLADTRPKRDLQAEAREYFAKVRKERAEEPEKTRKFRASMEDYQRQQQEEQMLAEKKKQKVENPFRSDYLAIKTQQDLGKDKKATSVDNWLDPNYKLSDNDKAAARQYAQAELAKYDYNSSKQPVLKSSEDRQHYADMVNLLNKTNGLTNAMTGVIKQPLNLAKTVRDVGRDVGNQLSGLGAAVSDKLGITEGATQRHNEKVDAANAFYNQNDESMQRAYENAKTQNPGATMLGEVGGQIGMYALTNPVFDSFGAAAGLGKAGSFALNQVGQNLQDVALDTLPTLNQYRDDNTLSDEEKKALLANIGVNAVGNLAFGAAGAGFDAWKQSKAAQNAANEAFRANVNEGAEKLAQLANLEDADNVVRNATRQAEEAAANIDSLAKQIPAQKQSLNEIANTPVDDLSIAHRQVDRDLEGLGKFQTIEENDAVAALNKEGKIDELLEKNPSINRISNSARKQESILANEEISLANQIDRYVGWDMKSNEMFDYGVTPDILKEYGIKGNRIMMSQKVFDKISLPDKYPVYKDELNKVGKHGFDRTGAMKLIRALDDPAIIYKANTAGDVGVVVNLSDKYGNPVLVPLTIGKDGTIENVSDIAKASKIKSAHIRHGLGNYFVNHPGDVYYIKGDAEPLSKGIWNSPLDSTSPKSNITDAIENVNKETINNIDAEISPNKVMAESADFSNPEKIEPLKIEEEVPPTEPISNVGPEDGGLKERGQSKHIRGEGAMQMEGVSDEVVADFQKDPDMYNALTNAETSAKAQRIYDTSENPETDFRDMLSRKDPAALPLGHQLAKDYSAQGNHAAAAQIYRDMGKALTESGQFSQAAVINMMKDDPMTALNYAIREIDGLNEAGAKRFGKDWKNFDLTDAEMDAFNKITPGDSDAIKALYDQIGARLGKEYPTTFWDKLIEARRVAMLFNPRTNVRNLGANPPTLAMRWMADRVEAVGQNIAHLINPDIQVTQSLTGSGLRGRKIANEAFDSDIVKAMREGSGSKSDLPELKNSVMQHKQVFKGTAVEKWIDKVTDGGIQKLNKKLFDVSGVQSIPETVRNATYKLLDLGDRPFVKENFVERLGSYINATGIKSVDEIPEEAIQMAWEEAMKATYKDNSWAVDMLRNVKKGIEKGDNVVPGLGTAISQSAIPFVQAPGNIAARMVDYSPVGAGKGIADIIKGARTNDVKAVTKGIEEASKGLTGTGLIVLGMKLREAGLITGTYSEDKKQKAFEKQNGFKEFALHVGDKYFTYGWAQPSAQTIMVGSLLQDAIEKSDEYDSDMLNYFGLENSAAGRAMGVAKAGTKAAVNSWFNESPLSGLADFLKGNSYSDTDIAGNLWENGVQDFAGALIPSVVNATAKVVDTTQRNAYDPSNSFASFVNSNVAKIPGLSKTLPAKYDTWGREMKYAESKGAAAAARYLIPGEYSYDRSDEIDNEINRLFDATGEAGVFPTVANNTVDKQKLNNKEVSEYQKDMGTRSRTAAETFINSDEYKTLDDAEKVEVFKNIYGVSKAITERDKFDKPVADNSKYKGAIAAYDEAGGGEKGAKAIADYYNRKSVVAKTGYDSDSKAAEAIQEDLKKGNVEAAQEKVDAATYLQSNGLSKPGPAYTYYNAQEVIPSLSVEDFTKTYKAIDSDGNQGIKQDEVIDYLNRYNISSQSEGDKIWKAYYGKKDSAYIPKLENGTWAKKKK